MDSGAPPPRPLAQVRCRSPAMRALVTQQAPIACQQHSPVPYGCCSGLCARPQGVVTREVTAIPMNEDEQSPTPGEGGFAFEWIRAHPHLERDQWLPNPSVRGCPVGRGYLLLAGPVHLARFGGANPAG